MNIIIFFILLISLTSCFHNIDGHSPSLDIKGFSVRQYRGEGSDQLTDALLYKNMLYYVGNFQQTIELGTQFLTSRGAEDGLLVVMNKKFAPLWHKVFYGADTQHLSHVFIDKNENVYVFGLFRGELHVDQFHVWGAGDSQYDFFVAKFNPQGEAQFLYPFVSNGLAYALGGVVEANGNIILGGIFSSEITINKNRYLSQGSHDAFYIKINQNGEILDHFVFGGTGVDYVYSAHEDDEANSYIGINYTGTITLKDKTFINNSGKSYVSLVKMDKNNKIIWSPVFESTGTTFWIKGITDDKKGNIYFYGEYSGTITHENFSLTSVSSDIFYGKIKQNSGEVVWLKGFGGTGFESASSRINYYNDQNIFLPFQSWSDLTMGEITYLNQGNYDNVYIKIDSDGDVISGNGYGSNGSDRLRGAYFDGNELFLFGYLDGAGTIFGNAITTDGLDPVFVRIRE